MLVIKLEWRMKAYIKVTTSKATGNVTSSDYIISDKGDDRVQERFANESNLTVTKVKEVDLNELGSMNGPIKTQVVIF